MEGTFSIRDLQYKVQERELQKNRLDEEIKVLQATICILEGDSPEPTRTSSPASHGSEVTQTIYEILVAERPLHRDRILQEVQARGIYVGGTKPVNSIGSYLSQDNRFKNVGRGLWGLTDEPQDSAEVPPPPPEAQGQGVEFGPDVPGPIPAPDIEREP